MQRVAKYELDEASTDADRDGFGAGASTELLHDLGDGVLNRALGVPERVRDLARRRALGQQPAKRLLLAEVTGQPQRITAAIELLVVRENDVPQFVGQHRRAIARVGT